MNEPKKETVRIVLPPSRDGNPGAANPREAAMINLPPKPIPAAAGAPPTMPAPPKPVVPPAPGSAIPPKPPGIPLAPKPPISMPTAAPKPAGPAIPVSPAATAPKPPAPPAPIAPPKPPAPAGVIPPPSSVAASKLATPAPVPAPQPPTAPVAAKPAIPAPSAPKPAVAGPVPIKPGDISPAAKKETAKVSVTPATRPTVPQATVKLTQDAPAKPAPVIKTEAKTTGPAPTGESADQLTGILAIAAALVALIALGIQFWTFL